MTVSSQQSEVPYTGDGVTRVFPVPFYFLQNSDIQIVISDVLGNIYPAVQNVDYTVTGAGNQAGGSVTFGVAPLNLLTITIQRIVPATQLTDYQPNDDFPAETHERALDKLTMLAQQLLAGLARALVRPLGKNYYDANNYQIKNLAEPSDPKDATTKNWVSSYFSNLIDQVTGIINTTTGIIYDAGTLFDYLRFGSSRTVDNIAALRFLSGSRNQRAFVLGSTVKGDGGGGAYYVDPTDTTSLDNGSSIIVSTDNSRWKISVADGVGRVNTIAALRLVRSFAFRFIEVQGYYSAFDGGGGSYYLDISDTTSPDNGGTVIVASDGARWKLKYQSSISVKQFGAVGNFNKFADTGTDDTLAIQRAHDNIPRGVDVFYPNGIYWVSSRILVKGGSNIRFQSRSTATDNAKCAIIGSLALDGIVEIQSGDSTFSVKVVNMVVTRRNGSFANTSRGIILGGVDQTVLEDCASFTHGIPIHVAGQLAPYLVRLNTWNCTGSHVKISTCVEPRFTNCRFGRNGNADQVCDSYILIDGSGGIQVDTVEFLGCQFNQSGALANSVIRFSNYNNPNGIFGFTDSHLEGWGTYVVLVDATTTRLQRLKFNGCTITSSGSQFMGGNTVGVIEDMQVNGCTTAAIMTFNKVTSASITGGSLAGALVVDSGNTITTGLRLTGNATFVGVGKLTFATNQVSGTINDTFTGTKYVAGNI